MDGNSALDSEDKELEDLDNMRKVSSHEQLKMLTEEEEETAGETVKAKWTAMHVGMESTALQTPKNSAE